MVSCMCSVNYNEVARMVQPILKPQAEATPFLDLGCPYALSKPNSEVYMPMVRYGIIHELIYSRYE